ncbi:DoxX family protein [Saccharospirillum mangrovi]|uniref:DoxX family protein n=1 Tax=Saccharospirillum mangrovi TaxID=2161747 RepID=UPI0018E55B03|nr:DoxX family protein [Saccharospirillum mangrovi]
MTALFALFMLVASVAPKLVGAQVAVDSMIQLGWTSDYLLLIGIIELSCTLLFLIPRTALLGAILFTGLLGGALASNLNAGSPLFSHTLFSVYLGIFMWLALWLRDNAVRRVFPIHQLTD